MKLSQLTALLLCLLMLTTSAALADNTNSWVCPNCSNVCTANFCGKCGTARPAAENWFCTNCGTKLEADMNFCTECGQARFIDDAAATDPVVATPTPIPAAAATQKAKVLPPKFPSSRGGLGYTGYSSAVYNYTGSSSDVADYIIKLSDAGYELKNTTVQNTTIKMTYRNDADGIELEIEQMMSLSGSSDTILITYYDYCPEGAIVNGQIVIQ